MDFLPITIGALLLALLNAAAVIWGTLHVVLKKRDSRAALAWVGLIWLAPIVGALIYFSFGINRIQRKAVSLQIAALRKHQSKVKKNEGKTSNLDRLKQEYPQLLGMENLVQSLTGRALEGQNEVLPLDGGDETYPVMLEAIQKAELSISMVSYIFDHDQAGTLFLEALTEARKRGVEVRILIDHIGSRYSRPSMVDALEERGLQVESFLPTRAPRLLKYSNLRNHRKIMVIDGKVGFTGGTNIREGHWFKLEPSYPVQCMHFKIQGPVVAQLQETFAVDWAFASGEMLQGPVWFPDLDPVKGAKVWARGIADGPDEDFEKLLDTLVGALAQAKDRVSIITPYFLPEMVLTHVLTVAAMRGVVVEVIIPEKNNIRLAEWATMAQCVALLEKGCRIYLSPNPFDHTKLMVMDGVWSLIGSTNWDPRSLRLNFEYNVECYCAELGKKLQQVIEQKKKNARELTLEEVETLSLPLKLRNGMARLLTPYL